MQLLKRNLLQIRRYQSQKSSKLLDCVVNLCKQRGFVYPGSDLYGGLAGSFDYGPLGTQMKKNIQDSWWKHFIQKRADCVGIDSSVITSPKVWEKSTHIDNFVDPMIQCMDCGSQMRADKLIEENCSSTISDAGGLSLDQISQLIKEHSIACPCCKSFNFREPRQFNLLLQSSIGACDTTSQVIYMRPETAQGAYINFHNVQSSTRRRIPFGIGQMGKSFRNEISPGNFLFRTREFEQLELQYFCHEKEASKWFTYWLDYCYEWLGSIGIKKENLRKREHSKEELAHYASETVDIEYQYPFGWGELWGIANRGNYDLQQHMNGSGKNIQYMDPDTRETYLPHVIEPALGLNRLFMTLLLDAYHVEEVDGRERTVLRLNENLSPYKCAVLPIVKKPELLELSQHVYSSLSNLWHVDYDVTGSIGRRYRRHDEIGTPLCITVDSNSLQNHKVTIRARDSMRQEDVYIEELPTIWQRYAELNQQ